MSPSYYSLLGATSLRLAMELDTSNVNGAVKRKVKSRPFCTLAFSGCGVIGASAKALVPRRRLPRANKLAVCSGICWPSTRIALKTSRTYPGRNPARGASRGCGPAACADSIRPMTAVPLSMIVSPSIVTGPATDAANTSPLRTLAGESEPPNSTVRSVPEGRVRGCDATRKGKPFAKLGSGRSSGTPDSTAARPGFCCG